MARTFVSASNQWLTRASAILTAQPLTLACWARPASLAFGALVTITDGPITNYFGVAINTSGGASAICSAGAPQNDAGSNTTGTWGHYAAAFTATLRRAVFNGVGAGISGASGVPSGLNLTQIGKAGSLVFNGDVAEAAIWNVVLADASFVALAAGVSPLLVQPDALVAYWPLLGQYSPEIDLRGGNGLTLNNTPAAAPHCRVYLPWSAPASGRILLPHYIVGITRDAAGAAVAGVMVRLFRTSDNLLLQTTTSDASGNYGFTVLDTSTAYYLVAYKTGSPDRAGTTVNTLVGV